MTTDQNASSTQLQSLLVTNVDISDALKNQIIRKRDEAASKATFLQAELAQLFREIDVFNGLLAPIRRLPTDILLEVIGHYLGAELSSERMGDLLRLCHVTSRWRTLILETPLLWNALRISVGCSHVNSDFAKEGPRNQVLRDMLNTWLQRASHSTISLAIEIRNTSADDQHDDSTNGLFLNTLILPHLNRIKRLYITACIIPPLFFRNLFPLPNELNTLVLRERASKNIKVDYEDLQRAAPPLMKSLSRLRCVSLGGYTVTFHQPSHMMLLPWNQVTRLTLVQIPIALCFNILRRCPYLVQGNFEFFEQDTTNSVQPTILLMSLESLSLYFRDDPLNLRVLDCFNVPKLHSLRLGSSKEAKDIWHDSQPVWKVIRNIKSLALLGGSMNEEMLHSFLEHTPDLLRLELDVAANPGCVFDVLCPNSSTYTLLPLLQHISIAMPRDFVHYVYPEGVPLPFRLSKLKSFLLKRGFDEAEKRFHTVRHLVIYDSYVKSEDDWSNTKLAEGVRKLVSKGCPVAISMRRQIFKREDADWKC